MRREHTTPICFVQERRDRIGKKSYEVVEKSYEVVEIADETDKHFFKIEAFFERFFDKSELLHTVFRNSVYRVLHGIFKKNCCADHVISSCSTNLQCPILSICSRHCLYHSLGFIPMQYFVVHSK